jgi:D-alanyl-D-alanine carboxypeptidase
MKRLAWLILLVLVAPAARADSELAAPDLESRLQGLLEATLAANPQAPGLILWVACPPAGLSWSGAAGHPDFHADAALSPRYTFRVASNTKTYVATAILRLVELGKLDLDASIAPHLPTPWRRMLAADGYDLPAMTLRRVLSHTAGLNDHASDERYGAAVMADPRHRWTPDEQIGLLVEWFDPVGPAGGAFSYSDDGYILLGRVLENLTGRNLGPAVRELLGFEALGLNRTWWENMEEAPALAGPRAHQYIGTEDTYRWDPSLDLYGGGGIICDARDLGLFTRRLIKGQVLSEKMLAEMLGGGTPDYRLGLFCLDLGGHLALGHGGFWNTFSYHVPGMDLTVSGCILNHDAVKGTDLACDVVTVVANAMAD